MIKKNNINDVNKSNEEIIDLKRKLMNLMFQKSSGQLEKTSQIRATKKSIAKLKTKISKMSGETNA